MDTISPLRGEKDERLPPSYIKSENKLWIEKS
jgi:hypothetical protein